MRQHHRAGEKLVVDFTGQTIPVVNRVSGEIRDAQIFIAALGASNFTYAGPTWSQTLPDCCARTSGRSSIWVRIPVNSAT